MTDFGRRTGFGDMLKAVYDANKDGIIDQVIAHKLSHQAAGSDEITVAGLAGVLAAAQLSTWAQVAGKPLTFTPSAHKASHQIAGDDELNAAGLTGRINYVDRGDPAGYDYTQATITTDGDWHDLDLHLIVPAGATAIYLKVAISDDLLATSLAFRKKGNTNNFANRMVRTQEAGITHGELFFVPCDAGRVIEYKGTNTGFYSISIIICGWLI